MRGGRALIQNSKIGHSGAPNWIKSSFSIFLILPVSANLFIYSLHLCMHISFSLSLNISIYIYPFSQSCMHLISFKYYTVAEMRERLLVNPPTVQYIVKSVKYISLALELATCGSTYFIHVIIPNFLFSQPRLQSNIS